MCFLSLPPSITVVSEKDNSIKSNKNVKYDSTNITNKVFSLDYYIAIRKMLFLNVLPSILIWLF